MGLDVDGVRSAERAQNASRYIAAAPEERVCRESWSRRTLELGALRRWSSERVRRHSRLCAAAKELEFSHLDRAIYILIPSIVAPWLDNVAGYHRCVRRDPWSCVEVHSIPRHSPNDDYMLVCESTRSMQRSRNGKYHNKSDKQRRESETNSMRYV